MSATTWQEKVASTLVCFHQTKDSRARGGIHLLIHQYHRGSATHVGTVVADVDNDGEGEGDEG
jgi:hypothetical protein